MATDDSPIPEGMYWYTDADRLDQLTTIAAASQRVVELFASKGQPGRGAYADLADGAQALRSGAFAHDDLKELAKLLPMRPEWLDSRNPGWNPPQGGWIAEVSSAYSDLDRAVMELRALGSF